MDEKRKKELGAKGAVVAWTCATRDGLAHLFYLKRLGDSKYCLIREALLDEGDKKVAPDREWIAESKEKLGLLIMSISNMLRMRTVALGKYYILGIEEAVKEEKRKITTKEGLTLKRNKISLLTLGFDLTCLP